MDNERDRDLLRIATVGNRWELFLPPAKFTLHFLTLKSATSNSAEYIYGSLVLLLYNVELKPAPNRGCFGSGGHS